MQDLNIEQTRSTPKTFYDAEQNKLIISGQSYPENSLKFYEPIFAWMKEHIDKMDNSNRFEVDLILTYINTGSTKCILKLINIIENAHKNGKQTALNWYCESDNDSLVECAEEIKEDMTLPFSIIQTDD